MQPVFRFAPSPNGRLHLGHAYSALLNATLAQKMGGRFLVRMEDIDITRCTPELAEECLNDLAWLGLTWEKPIRTQSEHWDDYAAALEELDHRGLLYPCFCSRKDVASISTAKDPDGAPIYPGTCHTLSEEEANARIAKGEQHAWRINMEAALKAKPGPHHYTRFTLDGNEEQITVNPARWGDAILARKETPTSYHLSVVVDDAFQGITHIVRGNDLEAATDIHVLLQKLLRLPTPRYHHHALITLDGDKLSKSKGSESLADVRARGVTPQEIRARLGFE